MATVVGAFLLMWEAWIVLLASGFGLGQPPRLQTFQESTSGWDVCLCLSSKVSS